MVSWQGKVLNALLKLAVKPFLDHYFKRYLRSKNIKIIHRVRCLLKLLPALISSDAILQYLQLNNTPAVKISNKFTKSEKTILYLHGGGYLLGLSKLYFDLAYRLATICQATVYLIDYRLLPEHPFPVIIGDVLSAYRYLAETVSEKIILVGDSAGGGLVISSLIAMRDKKIKLPAAGVCFSPWVDWALTGESLKFNRSKEVLLTLPDTPMSINDINPYDPLVSPLYADLAGLPPLLIQASTSEILLDDAKRIAEKARAAGVNVTLQLWDDVPHVWQLFARWLPEGREAIAKVSEFTSKAI